MPQHTSYASLANSGKHSKRIAYFNSMGSTATATATATPTSSPCGSSYPHGPYSCSGVSVYYNNNNAPCCVSSGKKMGYCPSACYNDSDSDSDSIGDY
jgi:hypothetical protein